MLLSGDKDKDRDKDHDRDRDKDKDHGMSCDEMLLRMAQYRFATLETALYLDTHPNDLDVLERHNEYATTLDKMARDFVIRFNEPLTLYDTTEGFWNYINNWPCCMCCGGKK